MSVFNLMPAQHLFGSLPARVRWNLNHGEVARVECSEPLLCVNYTDTKGFFLEEVGGDGSPYVYLPESEIRCSVPFSGMREMLRDQDPARYAVMLEEMVMNSLVGLFIQMLDRTHHPLRSLPEKLSLDSFTGAMNHHEELQSHCAYFVAHEQLMRKVMYDYEAFSSPEYRLAIEPTVKREAIEARIFGSLLGSNLLFYLNRESPLAAVFSLEDLDPTIYLVARAPIVTMERLGGRNTLEAFMYFGMGIKKRARTLKVYEETNHGREEDRRDQQLREKLLRDSEREDLGSSRSDS